MMERLTWRRPGDNAVCPRVPKDSDRKWIAGEFTQEVYNRLAAYEDTGLEPEEIKACMDGLDEYRKAEAEGRLVVLPCKVGTAVYQLDYNQHDGYWVEPHFFKLDDVSRIGKTIFLTREEAEAALKGE